MRGVLSLIVVAGCAERTPPPLANAVHPPAGFPCGEGSLADLSPFEPAHVEPDGSSFPPPARRTVGACTVAASTARDFERGRARLTILEGDRPILSSSAPPYARVVVFDARIPTPGGIRVGMTGADLERVEPPFVEIECALDDPDWPGALPCGLRKARYPECAREDASQTLVVFEPTQAHLQTRLTEGAARAAVRARRIIAIDLGPPCD